MNLRERLIAIGSGALAISGMITLLARWALRDAGQFSVQSDEIQGQLAVVTREIVPGGAGEIAAVAGEIGRVVQVESLADQ